MRRCVIFGGGELKDIRFTQSLLREDDYIAVSYTHLTLPTSFTV